MPQSPNKADLPEAVVHLRVPFHDLDPMQVVWHGNYFKYFGEARLALFQQAGLEHLYRPDPDTDYLYPVVRSEVKHVRPLRFMDEFTVTARLKEAKYKLVIDFEIRVQPEDRICTRARTQQVAVSGKELTLHYEIPADVRRAFGIKVG